MFMSKHLKLLKLCVLISVSAHLMGCGATHTAINKRKMDVQTKMSSTVFLDPVTSDKKRVFLQVRNTSDKQELDLERNIAAGLEEKGYALVHNPEQAHYLLQANVLQVGRTDLRAAEDALDRGFGAALSGGIAGAAVGSLANRHGEHGTGMIVGGLVGAAFATVTDAMIQDVVYCVIADLQVSERVATSVVVKEKTKAKLKQGTKGVREITALEKVDWKRYQTRVISTANKVNLKFEQAAPELVQGLSRSISGIF